MSNTDKGDTFHPPPAFKPEILILVSGKRKCGKDYFTEKLLKAFGEGQAAVIRISAPIKHYWSEKNNLDYEKMLGASEYKEQHRLGMLDWSMDMRSKNYGYFNVKAIEMGKAEGKPVWICSDIRHKRDYNWFLEFYSDRLKRIRIAASEEVRKARGWEFQAGVDDGPSECNLDDVTDWDLVVTNNGNETDVSVKDAIEGVLRWHTTIRSNV